MADTPSARTKRLFEQAGFYVANVEKLNCFAGPPDMKCEACGKNRIGKKLDLFGIGDFLVFKAESANVTLVQATSGTNHAARRKKILANPIARDWIQQPCRQIIIASWTRKAKKKKDGTKSKMKEWEPRLEVLISSDFEETA